MYFNVLATQNIRSPLSPATTQVLVTPRQRLLITYRIKPKLLSASPASSHTACSPNPGSSGPTGLELLTKYQLAPPAHLCSGCLTHRFSPGSGGYHLLQVPCAFCYTCTNHVLMYVFVHVFPQQNRGSFPAGAKLHPESGWRASPAEPDPCGWGKSEANLIVPGYAFTVLQDSAFSVLFLFLPCPQGLLLGLL